ncbi:biotin--[acetyl-CoA-carboxylase] ligase [Sporosarcina sp. ANT_H38]|uniref:biotin--[acetyl-CoA-carboxylase] ligase n=1 Tax=Sporosarcina sp. ANT_H38 TaxID=2597358 RepID=UPI0011F34638|nr:biotin--[acetyl-CoA-carboxylase] ligase [Sporosarcina sp. ANT_H38]KAA0966117.1 biotin--[acetyl-CoA-carboxylase] ligase [Sporosarcina sp. ANT_H38]
MNSIVKNELLKRLFEAEGEPVSGQEIADQFGLSRTAIWKYVKEIEKDGYVIGTIRKKGYYLIESPDRVNEANIQKQLTTKRYGRNIHYFETCTSTQIIAHDEEQNGALDGTVIISEEQTSGRGRMARAWSSTAGKGIWMSVIARPALTPQQAPQMTLVAAVAVTRAIQEITGIEPDIKWPNDILVKGKKVTGILTELQADPDQVKAIILGIGINVNQDQADFPDELHGIATSLKLLTGKPVDRAQLIAKTLEFLEIYTDLYVKHGFGPIKILWEGFSNTTGKRIRAVMFNETIVGIALGISEEGVLELKLDDGTIRGIYSADIELSN